MADKHGIVRLTRVAHVRGLRLARTAEEAQRVQEAAIGDHILAIDYLERQRVIVSDARDMFARNPACPQGKLWLDYNFAHIGVRTEAVIEAETIVEIASAKRAEAIRAVARHQSRIDRIADHHKNLRRADRLQAETLAELDAAVTTRAATFR